MPPSCQSKEKTSDDHLYDFIRLTSSKEKVSQLTGIPNGEIDPDQWWINTWADTEYATVPAGKETGQTDIFSTVTSKRTGKSYGARFTLDITIQRVENEGSAAGGMMSVYSSRLEILNVRISKRFSLPEAKQGFTPILPGQCVVRPLPKYEGENQVLERFIVELPANRRIRVHQGNQIDTDSSFYWPPVDLSISRKGITYQTEFNSPTHGLYEIVAVRTQDLPLKTGWYNLQVYWPGNASGEMCQKDPITVDAGINDSGDADVR